MAGVSICAGVGFGVGIGILIGIAPLPRTRHFGNRSTIVCSSSGGISGYQSINSMRRPSIRKKAEKKERKRRVGLCGLAIAGRQHVETVIDVYNPLAL